MVVCVRPINQTGIIVGIITQAPAPFRDKPRITVQMPGVQVPCHQDGKPPLRQADRSAPIWGREGEK